MTHRTIQIRKDPGVAPITELTDYDAFCGLPSAAVGGEVTADELRDILADPTAVDLIDVREQAEWDIAHLPGARLIPMGRLRSQLQGGQLTSERPIVLYCKVGARSAEALGWLREAGFADSRHLAEGIDGWSRRVDPSLPRY